MQFLREMALQKFEAGPFYWRLGDGQLCQAPEAAAVLLRRRTRSESVASLSDSELVLTERSQDLRRRDCAAKCAIGWGGRGGWRSGGGCVRWGLSRVHLHLNNVVVAQITEKGFDKSKAESDEHGKQRALCYTYTIVYKINNRTRFWFRSYHSGVALTTPIAL
jgi:hypothetical protein